MNVYERFRESILIPVVVLERTEDAAPLAEALLKGGVRIMEITLRTDAGIDCIKEVSARVPDILTGAGTVISRAQCEQAIAAGARFIVSPGLSPEIIDCCREHDIPVIPGCATPTEIMTALSMGIDTVKFFPADVYGGPKAIKALSAPFGNVRFIPTGGINAGNIPEYMALASVLAVGGSGFCSSGDIRSGRFEHITASCREAREAASGVIRKQ